MPPEKIPVSIVKCPDYDREEVRSAFKECLEPLGGIGTFVRTGDRVLLKPNLLSPHPPKSAVCTHPEVVRAVAQLVLEAGGTPFIGDSPAASPVSLVLKRSGIMDVVRELGIRTVSFRRPVKVPVPGNGKRRSVLLAREAVGFDLVINLARFKTHSRMVLSLAVKNMFGTVVGAEKAGWHLKAAGTEAFADLLLDVWRAASPGLSVLDGIAAMEGNGPGAAGSPFPLGLVLASPSALALDRVAGEVAGVSPERHPVVRRALERGMEEARIESLRILGPELAGISRPFVLPPGAPGIEDRIPGWVKRPVKKSIGVFPVLDGGRCSACGQCAALCPVDAIALFQAPRTGGEVDKGACIGCFCCQETCPEGAIDLVPGGLLRLLRWAGFA